MAENLGIDDKLFNYLNYSFNKTSFYNLLGLKLNKIGKGFVELSVISTGDHENSNGIIHGGLFMAINDAAMGNAVRSTGIKTVTVDCSTEFISSAKPGEKFLCRGKVLKAGKNLFFAVAELSVDDRLVSTSHGTFFKTGDYNFLYDNKKN